MSRKTQSPPLLRPYLDAPPPKSLLLITETLTNTANWLTAHLISLLLSTSAPESLSPRILLISWLHDKNFWKTELKRLAGINIPSTTSSTYSPIHLIDLLTPPNSQTQQQHPSTLDGLKTHLSTIIPGSVSPLGTLSTNPQESNAQTPAATQVHIILSGLTTPIATGQSTAAEILTFVRWTRRLESVHSVSVILPFLGGGGGGGGGEMGSEQMVEKECGNVMVSLAHGARFVIGVRGLETGAARDISGEVRVSRGGGFYEDEGGNGADQAREMEGLYFVKTDGSVEVRERGAT